MNVTSPYRDLRALAAIILCGALATASRAQEPVPVRLAAAERFVEPLPAPATAIQTPAHQPQALTLLDLEQIALTNNPSLARAGALVGAARGNWVQVGLPPNFSAGYLGQQLGSGGQAEQHALLIDGEWITGGKLRLNRQIAAQEVTRAEQNFAAQERRVLTDVRIAFYDALLAQRGLDLAQELLAIAQRSQAIAQRLLKAEETSKVDLLQANIESAGAEISVNAARNRHLAAWQSLTAVIGVPHLVPTPLCGQLDAIPAGLTWDETLSRVLSTSPEIAAAVANLDRAYAALARARHEPIPNVRFQGGVMQDQGIGGKTDGLVQLLLPLPIINRNQGAIRQAESEVQAAQQTIHQVELDLQNRLAPVYERYTTAAYQVQRYRDQILPAAQESLNMVRRVYEGGEFPYFAFYSAQRVYFQTSLQHLQALRELHSSAAEIEGLLLRNSLSTSP